MISISEIGCGKYSVTNGYFSLRFTSYTVIGTNVAFLHGTLYVGHINESMSEEFIAKAKELGIPEIK